MIKKLKTFLKEEEEKLLIEKLITFRGKAYPKFGTVVIMAGGAGSGKGFVKNRLVGVEGFTFDVDEIKKLAMKTTGINQKIKAELGVDLSKLDLKNPSDVSKVHEIIGDYLKIDNKRLKAIYTSILSASRDRKPNMIFDVTLKNLDKLNRLTSAVKQLGYEDKNIHIVWVVNDIEVAIKQNAKRDRTVPVEILVNTHRGVSQTMIDIINMGKKIKKYLNGDVIFAFNKVGVDSELVKSGRGGSYVKDANYFYVKKAGQDILPLQYISNDIKRKIAGYVPKNVDWE
jgi:predicted kinase